MKNKTKLLLIFLLFLISALTNFSVIHYFEARQKTDGVIIDVAGCEDAKSSGGKD